AVHARKAPDTQDSTLAVVILLGDDRHFPVEVTHSDAYQPLVRHPLAQRKRMEVAQAHGVLGKRLMEAHHQGLILGTDRAQRYRLAALDLSACDILRGIGPDGQWRDRLLVDIASVNHHASIQGDYALVGDQERIYIDFL